MRVALPFVAAIAALLGCGSEENTVISGYPPAVISPVKSSISALVNFKETTGATHPQWVIILSDGPDLCTKVTQHLDYFQNPIENFVALVLWVPPGNLGTFSPGFSKMGTSTTGNEVLVGGATLDGGAPGVVRLPEVDGGGTNIGLSEFSTGPGGEAQGSFDVGIFDPAGNPREYVGKFKATYCPGAENALLP
jgi:hypothetical protein